MVVVLVTKQMKNIPSLLFLLWLAFGIGVFLSSLFIDDFKNSVTKFAAIWGCVMILLSIRRLYR